jgi:hypothetical protein
MVCFWHLPYLGILIDFHIESDQANRHGDPCYKATSIFIHHKSGGFLPRIHVRSQQSTILSCILFHVLLLMVEDSFGIKICAISKSAVSVAGS